MLSRIHFYTDWNMVMQWHNTKMRSLLRVLRSCSPSNVIAITNTPISAATSETCGLDIYYILDGSSSTGVQMYELIKGVSGCIVGWLIVKLLILILKYNLSKSNLNNIYFICLEITKENYKYILYWVFLTNFTSINKKYWINIFFYKIYINYRLSGNKKGFVLNIKLSVLHLSSNFNILCLEHMYKNHIEYININIYIYILT